MDWIWHCREFVCSISNRQHKSTCCRWRHSATRDYRLQQSTCSSSSSGGRGSGVCRDSCFHCGRSDSFNWTDSTGWSTDMITDSRQTVAQDITLLFCHSVFGPVFSYQSFNLLSMRNWLINVITIWRVFKTFGNPLDFEIPSGNTGNFPEFYRKSVPLLMTLGAGFFTGIGNISFSAKKLWSKTVVNVAQST